MHGQNPKAGPKPDAVNAGAGARCGAEAQKWGRNPMRGRSPMHGQNPKAGPKPDVKCGARARCGAEARCNICGDGARCRARARCGAGAQCSKCVLDKKVQEMQKQRSMLRNSAWHCQAVTLIFLVVLLCGARMET
ncbi:hypothetical protein CDL15_Pgr000240 [Punica granatum]|uniref:Uncharacterized protein n=1 Tax=Punica granatum TaxID=22663 RepID=A0A218Y342_PUNGR|nr:hypothetical protein CDL15_Pgr000240 [Punica granatum]